MSVQAQVVFDKVQARYGSHPEFAANSGAIQALIQQALANPAELVPILKGAATIFPQAAVWLNGAAGILAVLTPAKPATSAVAAAKAAPH